MYFEDKWWLTVCYGLLCLYFGIEALLYQQGSYIGIGISYLLLPFIQNNFGYIGLGIFFIAGGVFLIHTGITNYKEKNKNEKNT